MSATSFESKIRLCRGICNRHAGPGVIPGVVSKYDTGMAMITFGKLVAAAGAFSALAAHTAQSYMGKAVWCPGPTLSLKVSGVPGPPPATHMQTGSKTGSLDRPPIYSSCTYLNTQQITKFHLLLVRLLRPIKVFTMEVYATVGQSVTARQMLLSIKAPTQPEKAKYVTIIAAHKPDNARRTEHA